MKRKVSHVIPFRDGECVCTGTFHPAAPATRLDPPDPAEFELESVIVDGNNVDLATLTDDEADAITERMIELCEEQDEEGPDDWSPDDLDRARFGP